MGRLRIIAGELRGRRVEIPPGPAVRPTPERVREALFSILGPSAPGPRVLDLYAGSGLLGLEALSRGAESVLFVEQDSGIADLLERNLALLGVSDRCKLVRGRVLNLLRQGALGGPHDLVLADPPYASHAEAEALLRKSHVLLASRGRLVLERDARRPAIAVKEGGLTLSGSRRYGDTALDFYEFPRSAADGGGRAGPASAPLGGSPQDGA